MVLWYRLVGLLSGDHGNVPLKVVISVTWDTPPQPTSVIWIEPSGLITPQIEVLRLEARKLQARWVKTVKVQLRMAIRTGSDRRLGYSGN